MTNENVTALLHRARDGDQQAFGAVYDVLYRDLQRIARKQLGGFKRKTLNTIALINESYLRLVDKDNIELADRTHFLALSARIMRQILVDYYRRQSADKRGGALVAAAIDCEELPADARDSTLLELDESLDRLESHNERLARVVEYKYFGGMTYEDIAEELGIAPRTVRLDWRKAKAWLTLDLESN
jgi:RNA polymerase sigma factor (TIGR02999 family)